MKVSLAMAGLLTGCAGSADLVISWDGPERMGARNNSASVPALPEKEFFKRFAVMPLEGRGLAVVSLGSSADEAVLEKLELMVRAAGFQKIRFVQEGRTVRVWERTEGVHWMEDFEAVTRRAFEQDAQADLSAWADRPSKLQVYVSGREGKTCSVEEFIVQAGSFTDRRDVAVVIMGKAYTDDDEDRIYEALRRAGFRKVAIQQAHSRGRPILRE